jgi:hypothetical protein
LTQRLQDAGLTPGKALGPIVHILTHRRYEVLALRVHCAVDKLPSLLPFGYPQSRLQPLSEALGKESGLSRLAQKLLQTFV